MPTAYKTPPPPPNHADARGNSHNPTPAPHTHIYNPAHTLPPVSWRVAHLRRRKEQAANDK